MESIEKKPEISGYKEAETDAHINGKRFKQLRGYRSEWMKDRVENDDFFHGQHYSAEERLAIEARGQAPLAINITYSVVKQIISMITSVDPTWKVTPVGEADKSLAYLHREALNATWYNSRGGRVLSQIVKDTSIAGVGYGHVTPVYDEEGFSVHYSHIPYWQSYLPPGTSQFDYNDAEDWVISKMMGYKGIAELFDCDEKDVDDFGATDWDALGEDYYPKYAKPSITQVVSNDGSNSEEEIEPERQKRVIQRYTKERVPIYIVESSGTQAGDKNSFQLPRRVYFKLTDDLLSLEAKGLLRIKRTERKVVARYLSCGTRCIRTYLPIDKYQTIPYIDEFRSNPYPLGVMDFVYPLQRALNKFILLSILNATLANNMQMMAEDGSIDVGYWEENFSTPGAIMTWKRVTDKTTAPEQRNPQALPASFFEFPKLLIEMIEYITGMFGIMQGNPDGAPRTLGGVSTLQSMGGQKVKLLTRNISDALSAQGDVVIQLYQNYSPYNQVINYAKGSEDVSVPYNTTIIKEGQLFVDKDISAGRYKTRVTIEPNYGGERQAKAAMMANLAMQTKSPALIGPLLKLADIPEADEIAKAVDVMTQANQTIEQMQEKIKRLEQINDQLQNEIIQKAQKVEITQFAAELDKMRNKMEKELGIKVATEFAKFREELHKSIPAEKSEKSS